MTEPQIVRAPAPDAPEAQTPSVQPPPRPTARPIVTGPLRRDPRVKTR